MALPWPLRAASRNVILKQNRGAPSCSIARAPPLTLRRSLRNLEQQSIRWVSAMSSRPHFLQPYQRRNYSRLAGHVRCCGLFSNYLSRYFQEVRRTRSKSFTRRDDIALGHVPSVERATGRANLFCGARLCESRPYGHRRGSERAGVPQLCAPTTRCGEWRTPPNSDAATLRTIYEKDCELLKSARLCLRCRLSATPERSLKSVSPLRRAFPLSRMTLAARTTIRW